MADSIKHFTGFDINGKTEDEIRDAAKGNDIPVDETMGKGKLIDEIFGEKCEGNYIQPTFITDYPKEMSPLCKEHRDNPELTERFELMVCGKEIANAYSELNDPIDQRARFEHQLKLAKKGDDEATEFIDEDFLRALRIWNASNLWNGHWNGSFDYVFNQQPIHSRSLIFPTNASRTANYC